jgi:hypothetical protein
MKTPQQIKNEVEEEIERYNYNIPFKDDKQRLQKQRELKAQLSILTEYDKSIKEIIEDIFKLIKRYGDEVNYEHNGFVYKMKDIIWFQDMISKMKILSKIGDNSEVKE